MPIEVKCRLAQGWQQLQNKRFGDVLEIVFINTQNGSELFRYAPKLDDEVIFKEYFEHLKELDETYKQLKSIMSKIENSTRIRG